VSIGDLFLDFPSEGFTPIPDDLLDWIAPVLSDAELRTLLYICRRTYGFRKQADRISLDQFCSVPTSRSGVALDLGTGMSRQGVLNAIDGLKDKGVIDVLPGRGRGQVSQYEILLSQEALARIEKLLATPREMVNAVDPLHKPSSRCFPHRADVVDGSQKGQQSRSQKVNVAEKTPSKMVYLVDPQEKVYIQEKGFVQEKASFARPDARPPENTHPTEEDLVERLEGITGQSLTKRERTKLRALDPETAIRSLSDFSTETHWTDLPNRNAAFFAYLQGIASERSRQDYWDVAESEG
jgi:hypothetical protein